VIIYFLFIYFCGICAISSSRKHLLITVLRLEFVVLVLYFSIYFYFCSFNYSLIIATSPEVAGSIPDGVIGIFR